MATGKEQMIHKMIFGSVLILGCSVLIYTILFSNLHYYDKALMSHSEIVLNKYSILNQKILGSLALVSLLVADKCLCQHLSFVLFSLNVYAAIKD